MPVDYTPVDTFTVATFNVLHGRAVSGEVNVDLLARTCASLRADVLALQEVDRGVRRSGRADIAARVGEASGMAHVFGPAVRMGWRGQYGNALLVRGALIDVEVLPLPSWHGEPRSAIVARVQVAGLDLSVATTHLSIHNDESARQLETVRDALVLRQQPRVLLGDLNRRAPELGALRTAGLVLVDPTTPTFPAHQPTIRIDHVAVDGLAVVDERVVPTPCSDHRALIARLRIDH